jgi:hypothetical protein
MDFVAVLPSHSIYNKEKRPLGYRTQRSKGNEKSWGLLARRPAHAFRQRPAKTKRLKAQLLACLWRPARSHQPKSVRPNRLGATVYSKGVPLSRRGLGSHLESVLLLGHARKGHPKVRLFQRSQTAPNPIAMKGPPRIVASSAHLI